MTVRKRSVSLDEDVASRVERAAEEDGVSISAWLSRAAADRLRVRQGLRGIAEWEAEAGALSPAEQAAGQLLLDRLLAGKPRAPGQGSPPGAGVPRRRRSA